jgi:peptidoglycan/xylan/chitin deacetylase (PgdA/CDA1 family)
MNRYVLMSFDVEEFDMPLEYNFSISEEEQMIIGKQGLDVLLPLVHDIPCTMFTTANFAVHFPAAIKQMSTKHEIASHTFYHSHFENKDLLDSKLKLEEISGQTVTGLRMPRMRKVEMDEMKKAGYLYDSSINPTWLPGRYNNLHLPRTLYTDQGMKRLPASVSPNLRIPLFWLAFKNFPYPVFKQLAIQTLKKDGYVCLYFHPWEFVNINGFNLPGYTRKLCGHPLQERLHQLIVDLKKQGEFMTMQNWIQQKSPTL